VIAPVLRLCALLWPYVGVALLVGLWLGIAGDLRAIWRGHRVS
jgi:hypothetical protein